MTTKKKDVTSYEDAFALLSRGLKTTSAVKVGGMWDFVRDIWSLSFDQPRLFDAWHVGKMCDDVERAVEEKINYVSVVPRTHFKSTIIGHAFPIWRALKMGRDVNFLYLSYSDTMAKYHVGELIKEVDRNPILSEWMKNKTSSSDYTFRYSINDDYVVEIIRGGVFSFKRGLHVNGGMIADDILRDPDSGLNLANLAKVENQFLTEAIFIPNPGVPTVVVGTPQTPSDLLSVLENDERFFQRRMPALDPEPDRRVLFPERYTEADLLQIQRAKPKAFDSEFLLKPAFSDEAYFDAKAILACEDGNLENHSAEETFYKKPGSRLYAGCDVGKKRNPSHIVIFEEYKGVISQVHQSWLDNWEFTAQVKYLNSLVENFDLDYAFYDNTRGELEDRGLNNKWYPMHFSTKSKNEMAQIFEEYVHSGKLHLLRDERQRSQILAVNNELKAPDTVEGHGDAFFSIAMALRAVYDSVSMGFTNIGNVLEWAEDMYGTKKPTTHNLDVAVNDKETDLFKVAEDRKNEYNEGIPKDDIRLKGPNPSCEEDMCVPQMWVQNNRLCLQCGSRKEE